MKQIPLKFRDRLIIGRNEWCGFKELGMPAIKAKVDTGAQTSALHAFDIKPFVKRGQDFVRFSVHPLQANERLVVTCSAPIFDERAVMSSNGHKESRYVIKTMLSLGDEQWEIELTLSNRDPLRFRMLLGREAMKKHTIVLPDKKYIQGKVLKSQLRKYYHAK